MKTTTLVCSAVFACNLMVMIVANPSIVDAQRIAYKTHDILTNLNCPWEIRWGKDNWIWFTERAGRFNRVDPATGERKMLLFEKEVYSISELGMLGFDFHPDFPDSPFIYLDYTVADSTFYPDTIYYFEKVVRYRYTPDTLTERTTIFKGIKAYFQHNGSRVVVGPDRKLYVSSGETWFEPELAQQDSSPNGKILRLNLDGSIPEDNPWKRSPVWTKGHRNPQGLAFGPDGTLYSSEHGPANDDEFNIIIKGRNYGWPMVEGFCDKPNEMQACADSDVVEPVVAWTPTIALSGIDYYDNDRIPEWKNSILVMSLKDESIWQLKMDSTRKKVMAQTRYHVRLSQPDSLKDSVVYAKRLRDVCFSPDGRVFVSTSNVWSVDWTPDRIFEITRTGVSGVIEPIKEKMKESITVTPNPAADHIRVNGGFPPGKAQLTITDQLGRIMMQKNSSSGTDEISLQGFAAGVYFLNLRSSEGMNIIPFIKQ